MVVAVVYFHQVQGLCVVISNSSIVIPRYSFQYHTCVYLSAGQSWQKDFLRIPHGQRLRPLPLRLEMVSLLLSFRLSEREGNKSFLIHEWAGARYCCCLSQLSSFALATPSADAWQEVKLERHILLCLPSTYPFVPPFITVAEGASLAYLRDPVA